MNNATDRNPINTDNYQFYFNKLPTSKGIKIQNVVLTKETVKAIVIKSASAVCGILCTFLMLYNYMNPDTGVKTAGLVAAGASNILNRRNSLFSHGYGDDDKKKDKDEEVGDQRSCFADKQIPSYTDQQSPSYTYKYKLNRKDKSDQPWNSLTDEYLNKKTGTLNKKGRDDLNNLFKNNQKFREKIINFVRDKAGWSNEQIIDKRYKYNTLNRLGRENLNTFIWSRDNTKF